MNEFKRSEQICHKLSGITASEDDKGVKIEK